jgi:hypothetical protein
MNDLISLLLLLALAAGVGSSELCALLERIVAALERIAAALEKLASKKKET